MNNIDVSKLPSIPQYFKQYIDPHIDLDQTPHIPCPLHNEVSGKSFSYSKDLGIWRCFGACHSGGTVIELHQLNMKMRSKKEALQSLCTIYEIPMETIPSFELATYEVDEKDVYRRRAYALACKLAVNPDDWVELDYILSKYPYDVKELELFCSARGQVLTKTETEDIK